jgi:hypothetical protein
LTKLVCAETPGRRLPPHQFDTLDVGDRNAREISSMDWLLALGAWLRAVDANIADGA